MLEGCLLSADLVAFGQRHDGAFGLQVQRHCKPTRLQIEVDQRHPLAQRVAQRQGQIGSEARDSDASRTPTDGFLWLDMPDGSEGAVADFCPAFTVVDLIRRTIPAGRANRKNWLSRATTK